MSITFYFYLNSTTNRKNRVTLSIWLNEKKTQLLSSYQADLNFKHSWIKLSEAAFREARICLEASVFIQCFLHSGGCQNPVRPEFGRSVSRKSVPTRNVIQNDFTMNGCLTSCTEKQHLPPSCSPFFPSPEGIKRRKRHVPGNKVKNRLAFWRQSLHLTCPQGAHRSHNTFLIITRPWEITKLLSYSTWRVRKLPLKSWSAP